MNNCNQPTIVSKFLYLSLTIFKISVYEIIVLVTKIVYYLFIIMFMITLTVDF
jgi:hypothetical protein